MPMMAGSFLALDENGRRQMPGARRGQIF